MLHFQNLKNKKGCRKQSYFLHKHILQINQLYVLYLQHVLWRYGLIICSWVVHSNTWTSTEKRRESASKRCVEPLMAAVQREQIHSCSHWLDRRGVICSNQPGCCYKSPPGSAVSFTTLYFLSSRLSVFISAFLVSDEQKNLSWFKATWASSLSPSSLRCFSVCEPLFSDLHSLDNS